jgi:hypothetical protein
VERAGGLVEADPLGDGERLGDVDLDVVDVVAVPDRLDHAVGEAQREDVLDALLSRRWSIRKTCCSSSTQCTSALSRRAEARSVTSP